MPTATHVWRAMRDITEEERRHYHHHGVVHLPDFLDDDWIGRLEAAFAEEMAADQAGFNFWTSGPCTIRK